MSRILENIAEFARQQQERSRLVRFILSNEDNQQIQRHRQEIQDASKRFQVQAFVTNPRENKRLSCGLQLQINSLLSIHSQLSVIVREPYHI